MLMAVLFGPLVVSIIHSFWRRYLIYVNILLKIPQIWRNNLPEDIELARQTRIEGIKQHAVKKAQAAAKARATAKAKRAKKAAKQKAHKSVGTKRSRSNQVAASESAQDTELNQVLYNTSTKLYFTSLTAI